MRRKVNCVKGGHVLSLAGIFLPASPLSRAKEDIVIHTSRQPQSKGTDATAKYHHNASCLKGARDIGAKRLSSSFMGFSSTTPENPVFERMAIEKISLKNVIFELP